MLCYEHLKRRKGYSSRCIRYIREEAAAQAKNGIWQAPGAAVLVIDISCAENSGQCQETGGPHLRGVAVMKPVSEAADGWGGSDLKTYRC